MYRITDISRYVQEETIMEFKDIVQKRYATKLFDKDKKLPNEKVDALLELVRYAPSSFNLQPWKVIVITDKELKEKLLPLSWNQPQVTSCSHLLVFCANTDVSGNIDLLEKQLIKNGAKPEDINGYISLMRGFEKNMDADKKLGWAQRQVYLALGNALNGAKALGFDSCPMEGFDPKGYAEVLELPENLVATTLCPIGYAADTPKPKVRFRREDVFVE